jgi:hypothetical protein
MADRAQVRQIEEFLRSALPRSPRLECQWPSFGETYLSDWLSRGDRQAGKKLLAVMGQGEARGFRLPYREYLDEMARILRESGSARTVQRASARDSQAGP